MSSETVTTEALLARSVDYGEAHRICELLTRSHGRISVLARGARRSRRRFGGALSLFVISRATVKVVSGRELHTLERLECQRDLGGALAGQMAKMAHGSYIVELARELWPVEEPDPPRFELVCLALTTLAEAPASPALLRAYELQLLGSFGLAPNLQTCVRCGRKELSDPCHFDVAGGGVVCGRCPAPNMPLPGEALAALRLLAQTPLPQAAGAVAHLGAEPRATMQRLMLAQLRYHLGKDLKSLQFIGSLTAGAQ